jgi:hypothetical protein
MLVNYSETSNADEFVSLEEAKTHLRVTHSEEDALITAYISSARDFAERYTRRKWRECVIKETHRVRANREIELIYNEAEDVVIDLLDSTKYEVITGILGTCIELKSGMYWPDSYIIVTYTTGNTPPPASVRHAILLIVGDYYENREDKVKSGVSTAQFAAQSLLNPFRKTIV